MLRALAPGFLGSLGRLAGCSHTALQAASSTGQRAFSAPPGEDTSKFGNEKVQKLAEDIVGLTVLECSWLSEILRKKLKIEKPAMGAMPMMAAPMMGAMPAGGAPAAAAAQAADKKEEKKEEKTSFSIKLDSFPSDAKIKVIKEIRVITNLGLKEAKELVGASCSA